ncbi:MAG: zinc ribbon domain-containing protein [Oscillospiraceae bacterium]|nr:zinc ribbon domain-containing protein [Oscillospiraceae bacterium]
MSIKCKCGCENPDNAVKCENCGEKIGVRQNEYNSYQSIPQNAQPQYYQQPQQQYYQQPQQPYYQQNYDRLELPVSIGGWIGYLILFSIPIVNIITYIVILCASQNKTLKNFILAQLILVAIVVVLLILGSIALGVSVAEFFDSLAVITA